MNFRLIVACACLVASAGSGFAQSNRQLAPMGAGVDAKRANCREEAVRNNPGARGVDSPEIRKARLATFDSCMKKK